MTNTYDSRAKVATFDRDTIHKRRGMKHRNTIPRTMRLWMLRWRWRGIMTGCRRGWMHSVLAEAAFTGG